MRAAPSVRSAQRLPGGPAFKSHSFFIACQTLFSSTQDREAPAIDRCSGSAGIPALGSCFPHAIKKHFVLNKTRQSIYIPQPGRGEHC